jgi:hypothetical protein
MSSGFAQAGPTNIEQGPVVDEPNPSPAGAASELHAYFARKRSVCASALLLIIPAAAIAAARAPVLGLDLLVGVGCGIAYALLVMRSNERLAVRDSSPGKHARGSVLRVFAFGAVPVMTTIVGPAWGMGLYFAGFFAPLALYAAAVRREISRQT